jgi:hypothetical protein
MTGEWSRAVSNFQSGTGTTGTYSGNRGLQLEEPLLF